jgi:hypothetical protein
VLSGPNSTRMLPCYECVSAIRCDCTELHWHRRDTEPIELCTGANSSIFTRPPLLASNNIVERNLEFLARQVCGTVLKNKQSPGISRHPRKSRTRGVYWRRLYRLRYGLCWFSLVTGHDRHAMVKRESSRRITS